ncbi:condensation domain-containing protein [Sphaerimonospora cavernae]|uniref:Condensation domain-containing protein n=1 Tax=Sphaerimonospora cavernae TaxID=1740611 RepID=A0ABV6TYZ2_9ACTN
MRRLPSYEQHGMWIAQDLRGRTDTSFLVRRVFRIRGALDVTALRDAISDVVARHEPLRTTFAVSEGRLTQVISAPRVFDLLVERVPDDIPDTNAWIDGRIAWLYAKGVDLEHGPVLSARLFAKGPDDHVLMLLVHHIAVDGWSFEILYRELDAFYAARLDGREPGLPELPLTYGQWADECRQSAERGEGTAALAYWHAQLHDLPAPLLLPTDRPGHDDMEYRAERIGRDLDEETLAGVEQLARVTRSTPFAVLLIAFAALLGHWSGRRDLVLGVATANRSAPVTHELVGCFASVLPVRLRLDPGKSFTEVLREGRVALVHAQEHELPFERIVQMLPPRPGAALEPLFRVGVSSVQGFGASLLLQGTQVEPAPIEITHVPHDLLASLELARGRGRVDLAYPVAVFDRRTIEELLDCYLDILRAVVRDPRLPISAASPLALPVRSARLPAEDPAPPQADPGDAQNVGRLTGELEILVAKVWAEVLEVEVRSGEDDFFLLGGSSLTAVRVVDELSRAISVTVPLRTVYEYSDLSQLAERLALLRASTPRDKA